MAGTNFCRRKDDSSCSFSAKYDFPRFVAWLASKFYRLFIFIVQYGKHIWPNASHSTSPINPYRNDDASLHCNGGLDHDRCSRNRLDCMIAFRVDFAKLSSQHFSARVRLQPSLHRFQWVRSDTDAENVHRLSIFFLDPSERAQSAL